MPDVDVLDSVVAQFAPDLGVVKGKWFGKHCIKVGDRVFVVLWGHDLAFKIQGVAHAEALQIPGAHLFDPRGKGSPMKEWVQIPASQCSEWHRLADLAYQYVAALPD